MEQVRESLEPGLEGRSMKEPERPQEQTRPGTPDF